ncbi:hypothetical protein XENOCAPTIV_023464 [Xenoophorus captivus]|uniref:tRNA (32-2'-O)-methyltransferase regulator THADA-like C-terminal TPR repeats region domain-containing protein n=1 Tax=Xenoophorus captivus TaxID=1517983 RepID=A0ABV0S4A4_9TELE
MVVEAARPPELNMKFVILSAVMYVVPLLMIPISFSTSALRMTGREFFTRFPALYPFLLTQLEEAAATVESDSGHVKLHPSLFLLLLVLSRLYPSPMDGSSCPLGLAPFMPLIMR